MKIYTDAELSKMLKTDLRNHLYHLGNTTDVVDKRKKDIINMIKYETGPYCYYRNIINKTINEPDKTLIGDQRNVFRSVFSFLMGITEKEKIIQKLNDFFIPEMSNLIASKLDYTDYPKIKDRLGLLIGGAGTGKTYMVSNIISKLIQLSQLQGDDPFSYMTIQILAPTNKAINVIKNKIRDILTENCILPLNLEFWTISKFLQQEIEYTSDGNVIYKTNLDINKNGYRHIKYIIIDESSMISRNNWNDLNTFVFKRLPNVKILLIGDDCQLPPVKELSSIIFNFRFKRFKLNDIVRTQSKEITETYNLYRDAVINSKIIEELPPEGDDLKYIKDFEETIKNNFNVDNDKVISYSNNSVDKYNDLVRNIIFNNPDEKYVVGEKVIFGSSVRCANINGSIVEAKYQFYANDEATVRTIEKVTINTIFTHSSETKYNLEKIFPEEKFDVYKLILEMDGSLYTVYKVQEDSEILFNDYFEDVFEKVKLLSKNKKLNRSYVSNLWNIFYTVKNTIDIPIKYSYALTVYKSQGSTFDKVFIDLEDVHECVKNNNVLNKTIYTSVTRASEKIHCFKPNLSDYYINDLKQFPYLKKYNRLDKNKLYSILKGGQNIIYTRNEYQTKNVRKLVRGRIIHILHNTIHVGNSQFSWELKPKDDIIVYLQSI
jgi:hypothetical protein